MLIDLTNTKQVPPTRKQQIASEYPHLWSRKEAHAQRETLSRFALQTKENGSKHSCTQIGLHHWMLSPHNLSLPRTL
ncbi:hypothetical protein OIU74_026280 [Salix koriyanagi]|uniref:Uncharacterized protein n=1 Tax=Salix koriyanagi TaxID=2511006 RepID=A0A9Q1A3V8_9ROSI|nr:hypothetical protein OIU74_026280 [Salix koriyanagi]